MENSPTSLRCANDGPPELAVAYQAAQAVGQRSRIGLVYHRRAVVASAIPRDKAVRWRVHKDGATAGQILGKFARERRAHDVGCRRIPAERRRGFDSLGLTIHLNKMAGTFVQIACRKKELNRKDARDAKKIRGQKVRDF